MKRERMRSADIMWAEGSTPLVDLRCSACGDLAGAVMVMRHGAMWTARARRRRGDGRGAEFAPYDLVGSEQLASLYCDAHGALEPLEWDTAMAAAADARDLGRRIVRTIRPRGAHSV